MIKLLLKQTNESGKYLLDIFLTFFFWVSLLIPVGVCIIFIIITYYCSYFWCDLAFCWHIPPNTVLGVGERFKFNLFGLKKVHARELEHSGRERQKRKSFVILWDMSEIEKYEIILSIFQFLSTVFIVLCLQPCAKINTISSCMTEQVEMEK